MSSGLLPEHVAAMGVVIFCALSLMSFRKRNIKAQFLYLSAGFVGYVFYYGQFWYSIAYLSSSLFGVILFFVDILDKRMTTKKIFMGLVSRRGIFGHSILRAVDGQTTERKDANNLSSEVSLVQMAYALLEEP